MDPCRFWKDFVDAAMPNPADELSDAELNRLVNHLTSCEPCSDEGMKLFDLLERTLEDPESLSPTDDVATFERAFHLNILVVMFIDVPT